MRDLLPPSQYGGAKIEHFTVSPQDATATQLAALINRRPSQYVPAGDYARLVVDGTLWMSDTPMEWLTNLQAIRRASGDVLIGGLGMGMIVAAMFRRTAPPPRTVTVIERHPDVIGLIGPQLQTALGLDDGRLTIVHGDIFTWAPPRGARYDTIYFDIWPDITPDSLADMRVLHARYRRHVRRGGWMDSWKRADLLEERR